MRPDLTSSSPAPYRTPTAADEPESRQEWFFCLMVFAVGMIPIIGAILQGGAWGVEPSLGMLLCFLSARALVADRRSHGRRA